METLPLGDRQVIRSFLERIRLQRLSRNWSQAEMARRVGLSRRAYQDFENGYGNITLTNLVRVLGTLGVSQRLVDLVPAPAVEPPMEDLLKPARQRARAKSTGIS